MTEDDEKEVAQLKGEARRKKDCVGEDEKKKSESRK